MAVVKGGVSPTAIYVWDEDGQHGVATGYCWDDEGTEHLLFDNSISAFVGAVRAQATALAQVPQVSSSPPPIAAPTATASVTAIPGNLFVSANLAVPRALAAADSVSPAVRADATIQVQVATAGADAFPTVSDANIAPPAATATATGRVPGVDYGGNALVSAPVALATSSAPVPGVAVNQNVAVPDVSADATAPVPAVTVDYDAAVPAASATAISAAPGISMGVPAVRAQSSAVAPVPVVTSTPAAIAAPTAAATATAPVPQVITAINATVTVPAPATTSAVAALPPSPIVDFYDNFDRANSSTIGNGWTETVVSGSGLAIASNMLAWTGTSDGSAYIKHATQLFTDSFDITITVGSTNNSRDSRIIGGADSSLGSYACVNWFGNAIYLARRSGSYPTVTDMTTGVTGITISAGDTIRFYRLFESGHWRYYVYTNATQRFAYLDTADTVTVDSSHRLFGAGLERASFANSGSFNDFRAKDYES